MLHTTTVKRYLRHALIRAGLEGVSLARAGRLWCGAGGRGIIFTLHHVRPTPARPFQPNAILSITPAFLEQAIKVSLEAGLVPLALEDLPERLADPKDKRAYVCFTLDDGYRDNALFAAPVFRKYQVPYTIFATAGFVERTRSIWWETVEALLARSRAVEFDFGQGTRRLGTETTGKKLIAYNRFAEYVETQDEDEAVASIDVLARDSGIDPLALVDELTLDEAGLAEVARDPLARIGAHSLTHVNLKRVPTPRLKQELEGSAAAVERYVGYRPGAFAYPYGYASAVGEREVQAARQAGYAVAVTTMPGLLKDGPFACPTGLNRVSLNGSYQRKRYVGALISGIPFRLAQARGLGLF
ncbi:polysaccharide deacetylase family protein [Chelativorans sp. SCAU2101]|jgi:Predicted xylanase/chitin deacetylase|uniref:Chitooligosaccharide deacetylase n=1 Tax=Chelativorans petroleitrophicus TaxID=2975484 RepID=A0A9X2XAJ1_9HYPH|nr:polysaccharide deacetylase family protein [Chelativorans petroleitrophicus]MCT8990690.1 polysaccharide deacetylase family protein [Chelativorans petroleitrophicus]